MASRRAAVHRAGGWLAVVLLSVTWLPRALALEEPRYTVVASNGAFEVRDYRSYLLAETTVEGSFDEAGNRAFRRLFDYIQGANRPGTALPMTAPVVQAPVTGTSIAMTAPVSQTRDGEQWRVAFVVPSEYDRRTVPEPTDARVRIVVVPARRVATWRFSGRWTERAFTDAEAALRAAITAAGLRAVGEVTSARYNSPFSLPFMRRNEVAVEVERQGR